METLLRYFPSLTLGQRSQLEALGPLYREWNAKINVISRKDMDEMYLHHILHSLSIARVLDLEDGARVMDLGTGGGFPGIPLAILFPSCRFHLVDSIGKKLRVAQEIASAIHLENVTFCHERVEDEKGRFDYVVSRAVMSLPPLWALCKKNLRKGQKGTLPGGLVCLKGGDLDEEIGAMGKDAERVRVWNISELFSEPFFETKKIVYVPF